MKYEIFYKNFLQIQVAVLAPLALLLVPEARCDHLVITHLKVQLIVILSKVEGS